MSTTSAYGWNIPDNTDLVKDGALAIRTLGNAIDTSMNTALGTKKAGLVLLNTTSFSAVASQAFTSIFSSTFNNYLVLYNDVVTSVDTAISAQLGATSTGYYQFGVYGRFNSATITGDNKSNNSSIVVCAQASANGISGNLLFFNPNVARRTSFETRATDIASTTGYYYNSGGFLNDNTVYTGFTLTCG